MKSFLRLTRSFYDILCGYQVPVWMTLVAVVLGALIANWWLPSLNAKFENEKIRSEYLLSNLQNLNSDVGNLLREVGTLNRLIVRGRSEAEIQDQRELVLRHVADLQWRTIEFDIIISSRQKTEIISGFSNSLDGVRASAQTANNIGDVSAMLCALKDFVPASHTLLKQLASEANVDLTESVELSYAAPEHEMCNSSL